MQTEAEEGKKASDELLRSKLQAQASENARRLAEARSVSLREREAAVAAAVAAKSTEFRAAKAVQEKANAALTARLEVSAWGGETFMSPGSAAYKYPQINA